MPGTQLNSGRHVDRHPLRRASGAAAITAIGAMTFGSITAPAANLPTGNVWIHPGSWNCPSGIGVVGVCRAIDNVSSEPAGGEWGDNAIYTWARIGRWSTTLPVSVHSASTSLASVRKCATSRGGIYDVSALNMSCPTALRLIGRVRYTGPSSRTARLKEWSCKTLGGYTEGATFRCSRRTSAFRWTAGG